jgi:peptidyl-prolyl cis-trans isomerase SurA
MLSSAAMGSRYIVLCLACWIALSGSPAGARAQELVDRIVAVVDDDAILLSEVDRALALTIIQSEEGEEDRAARRRTLDWLIEQRLRFHEVERYGFPAAQASAVDHQLSAIRARIGSAEQFREQLEAIGIDEAGLRQIVAQQLQVVTFVEERLGLRVFVSLSDIESYYETEVRPRLEAAGEPIPPLQDLREPIRAVIKEERLNLELQRWTDELRENAEISDFFDEKVRELPPVSFSLEGERQP